VGGIVFSVFKKSSPEAVKMTINALNKLDNLWREEGYEKFYFRLMAWHYEAGRFAQAEESNNKIQAYKKLLSEGYVAVNNGAIKNRMVQEKMFARIAAAKLGLEHIKDFAIENDLPFLDLIARD